MADQSYEDINLLDIKSVEAAMIVLEALESKLLKLSKKLKRIFKEFRNSVTQRVLVKLRNGFLSMVEVFQVDTGEEFSQAAAIFGQELAGSLYQAGLGFENLKTAIYQTAAPLVQALMPAVHHVIAFMTELALVVRDLVGFLFTGSTASKSYAAGAKSAASSSKALKKSLAGFDQITRLNGKEGGIAGLAAQSESFKNISAKMKELFAPLRNLDLSAASASLAKLKEAMEPLKQQLFEGLEWAWHNLFLPLANWTVTQLLPVFLDTLTVILQSLSRVIQELRPDIIWLWEECLKPFAQWKGGQIIADLQGIIAELTKASDWLGLNQGPVDDFIDAMRNIIQAVGELAQREMALSQQTEETTSTMDVLRNSVLAMFNPFQESAGQFWLITSAVKALGAAFEEVKTASGGAWNAISNIGNNGWASIKDKLIDPAYAGVRQSMNRIIDLANSFLQATTTGINHVGKALNSLSFTIPAWVPGLGGKSFAFSVKTLTPPRIPYLAKGAVLPANKPFMAVVGDQKHGTNVEAPLTVIQDAVANVMEDYSQANMAGHQATVAVLQELLSAVLGISIGEDMVAAAANRYERKMAVVRGGYV